jgi:hypothetical protein
MVAYVAWEISCGEVDGLRFEVGKTLDEVTDAPADVVFSDQCVDFSSQFSAPPVLLADMQTSNGGDTANLRWSSKDFNSVTVWVDEEQSKDQEMDHTTEIVGYLAIGETKPTAPLTIELGEVEVGDTWQRVDLLQQFSDPIVIAKLMSERDLDPAVVRIKDIDSSGFSVRVQEWDYLDGLHAVELIGYMVVERGRHQLESGEWIEAGRVKTNATKAFTGVSYQAPFETVPVVLSAVGTQNEADAVTTRLRNISQVGFGIGMVEQEANAQEHAMETLGYIAVEPSSFALDGIYFEVGRTPDAVTHARQSIRYSIYGDQMPILLGEMQTTNGGDTSTPRVDQIDQGSAQVWVQEEQSKDMEMGHTTETAGYIVIN